MTQPKKQEGHGGVVFGAGLIAAAIGAYFLYGSKEGPKRRENIKGWMLKVRGEVLEKIEDLKEMNQELYDKVVDEVSAKYRGIKNIDPVELSKVVSDIKAHWNNVRKQITAGEKKSRPVKAKK